MEIGQKGRGCGLVTYLWRASLKYSAQILDDCVREPRPDGVPIDKGLDAIKDNYAER